MHWGNPIWRICVGILKNSKNTLVVYLVNVFPIFLSKIWSPSNRCNPQTCVDSMSREDHRPTQNSRNWSWSVMGFIIVLRLFVCGVMWKILNNNNSEIFTLKFFESTDENSATSFSSNSSYISGRINEILCELERKIKNLQISKCAQFFVLKIMEKMFDKIINTIFKLHFRILKH